MSESKCGISVRSLLGNSLNLICLLQRIILDATNALYIVKLHWIHLRGVNWHRNLQLPHRHLRLLEAFEDVELVDLTFFLQLPHFVHIQNGGDGFMEEANRANQRHNVSLLMQLIPRIVHDEQARFAPFQAASTLHGVVIGRETIDT